MYPLILHKNNKHKRQTVPKSRRNAPIRIMQMIYEFFAFQLAGHSNTQMTPHRVTVTH